jgi:hypothetical protein
VTAVITGQAGISADSLILRNNGVEVSNTSLDQGTGNYGTYPLNLGTRGSGGVALNYYLYSLVIRGKTTDPSNLTQLETWVNSKTGAY